MRPQDLSAALLILLLSFSPAECAPMTTARRFFGAAPPPNDPTGALGLASAKAMQAAANKAKAAGARAGGVSKFNLADVNGVNYG